ncbi:MAG: hypothetical protein JWN76_2982 [Chitinophagaceae bacterium]|nr:hypothetical protein [Chitinophagaceae bacterium]
MFNIHKYSLRKYPLGIARLARSLNYYWYDKQNN